MSVILGPPGAALLVAVGGWPDGAVSLAYTVGPMAALGLAAPRRTSASVVGRPAGASVEA